MDGKTQSSATFILMVEKTITIEMSKFELIP